MEIMQIRKELQYISAQNGIVLERTAQLEKLLRQLLPSVREAEVSGAVSAVRDSQPLPPVPQPGESPARGKPVQGRTASGHTGLPNGSLQPADDANGAQRQEPRAGKEDLDVAAGGREDNRSPGDQGAGPAETSERMGDLQQTPGKAAQGRRDESTKASALQNGESAEAHGGASQRTPPTGAKPTLDAFYMPPEPYSELFRRDGVWIAQTPCPAVPLPMLSLPLPVYLGSGAVTASLPSSSHPGPAPTLPAAVAAPAEDLRAMPCGPEAPGSPAPAHNCGDSPASSTEDPTVVAEGSSRRAGNPTAGAPAGDAPAGEGPPAAEAPAGEDPPARGASAGADARAGGASERAPPVEGGPEGSGSGREDGISWPVGLQDFAMEDPQVQGKLAAWVNRGKEEAPFVVKVMDEAAVAPPGTHTHKKLKDNLPASKLPLNIKGIWQVAALFLRPPPLGPPPPTLCCSLSRPLEAWVFYVAIGVHGRMHGQLARILHDPLGRPLLLSCTVYCQSRDGDGLC